MPTDTHDIWAGAYKIPWDRPDFSRRMLAEHLSQSHDLASRRTEWIDQQVGVIHAELLRSRASRILDLGCGPGLYSHRLARFGHHCVGIDFGPASIRYARQHNPQPERCEFIRGDLRTIDFGGPFDLAMLIYGEMNVFPPREIVAILARAHAALHNDGKLILEVQTADAVAALGRSDVTEARCESSVFSDRPHRLRTVNQWRSEQGVAIQTFTVTEDGSKSPCVYRSTTRAWTDEQMRELLSTAGFLHASRLAHWPSNTTDLELWVASAKESASASWRGFNPIVASGPRA